MRQLFPDMKNWSISKLSGLRDAVKEQIAGKDIPEHDKLWLADLVDRQPLTVNAVRVDAFCRLERGKLDYAVTVAPVF